MYAYEFSSSMTPEERRDFVESIESDMLIHKHIEVMASNHVDALSLTSILESRHETNKVSVVHVHGRCLRIFAEPANEHSLMMFVVIKSI